MVICQELLLGRTENVKKKSFLKKPCYSLPDAVYAGASKQERNDQEFEYYNINIPKLQECHKCMSSITRSLVFASVLPTFRTKPHFANISKIPSILNKQVARGIGRVVNGNTSAYKTKS